MSDPVDNFEPQTPWGSVLPATRFFIEQSWWLAAELVRRHPDQVVYEMHPGGGLGDILMVRPSRELRENDARVTINRGGTIRVGFHHRDNRHDEVDVSHSSRALAEENPHTLIKDIEMVARLPHDRKSPASTPRSLAFRFASATLTSLLNDRHVWDWRQTFHDTSASDPVVLPYLYNFPEAQVDARNTALEPWDWGHPESHFWALLRDDEPIAIVSAEGMLYFHESKVNLIDAYKARGRNLHLVVGDLLLARLT